MLNFIIRYIGVRKLSKTLTHVASTIIGKYCHLLIIILGILLNILLIYLNLKNQNKCEFIFNLIFILFYLL